MNTIFIPVYPKPSGANVTRLDVDFNEFDPHNGIKFSVVLKNPQDLSLDRTYTCMYGDDWQDWPSEQTAQADYNYVKKVVLDNLGYTEAIAPFFIDQPQNANVNNGQPVLFSCLVSGDAPISYQWKRASLVISGATSNIYTIESATEFDVGSYCVNATNTVGSVDSSSVNLNINSPPTILIQPISLTKESGTDCQFNVAVQGTVPLTYQWQKDGVAIPEANDYICNLTGIMDSNAGNYLVTVSNIAGSVQSDAASLTVVAPQPIPPIPSSALISDPISTPIPDVIPDLIPDPIPTSNNA